MKDEETSEKPAPESLADIVRAMRNPPEDGTPGYYDDYHGDTCYDALKIWADRIEAAAKYSDAMCRKNEESAFKRGQQAAPDYYLAALREFSAETRKALEQMRQGCANIGYTASQVRERAEDYAARLREALDAPALAPGNAAAMREALVDSLKFWNSISTRTRREENLRLEIAAALAAPAPNA